MFSSTHLIITTYSVFIHTKKDMVMGACIEATLLVDDNRTAQVHIFASYLLLSQRKLGSLLS